MTTRASSPGYQLFMLGLCVYALASLATQVLFPLDPQTKTVLFYADNFICLFFLGDFLISLWQAPDRRRYMLTWGWLDLVSSIPMVDAARWGRVARIVRVFRVLRALRATHMLSSAILKKRAENTFLAVALVSILLIIFSSVAVLHFESVSPSANIVSAQDAFWWACTTITTVGYGDRYPVTFGGRAIAVVLMASGVGLFGTLSGFLGAWFLGGRKENDNLAEEIRRLREEILESRKQ